ncbi:sulfurtransferase complex subunit TusB [Candidatus Erwinia haradaeae]|uniref:Protein TusB n=1 Tax=Candidatus Erwinia haradaeae TaxID=1922217 RepID=A0A451D9U9_9GAMM|nr:sulfurtransferase complex subunit TusB [Candidatus Erwinia haradaeae]VFP83013.1 Protein TusB [Candidatus Erwinia haradaeae]
MLHMIASSPFQCDYRAILRLISAGDVVLLLGDGVIIGIESGAMFSVFFDSIIQLYVLKADLIARGLLMYISPHVQVITYNELINLMVQNPQQISW